MTKTLAKLRDLATRCTETEGDWYETSAGQEMVEMLIPSLVLSLLDAAETTMPESTPEKRALLTQEQLDNLRVLVYKRNQDLIVNTLSGWTPETLKAYTDANERVADYTDRLFNSLDDALARVAKLEKTNQDLNRELLAQIGKTVEEKHREGK